MMDKLLKILGADPYQYRVLLRINMTIDSRAKDSTQFGFGSSPVLAAIYAILSFLISLSAFALNSFSFTFLMIAFSMTMMSFIVIMRLESVINPNDYHILAHMPVSSRTYFLVKLTNILIHVALMASALNLPPSILGIWAKNTPLFFPAVYFPISFMAALFVTGLITSFYGYLIKLYKSDKFGDMVAYSQMAISLIFFVGSTVVPPVVMISQLRLSYLNVIERARWLYALPYSWFAGLVHLALGNTEPHYLFLSAIAMVSTILLVIIPLWRISLKYSERISYMGESPKTSRKIKKVSSRIRKNSGSIFARLFRDSETLAAFDLVSKYLKRDRNTKTRIYAGLALPLMHIVMMIRPALADKGQPLFTPVLAVGLSISSFVSCAYFISFVFSVIKFSEHWKAVWVIAAAPLEQPGNFFKGSKIAIIVYFIIPFFAVLTIIYSLSWGIFLAAVYILPSFIGSLCYLSFYSALNMYFPFSLEPQEKKRKVSAFAMILGFIIFGIVMGIQYPAYLVHKALYIALYSATIIAGLIIFEIQERRSNRRFGQFAMKTLQYESHL